ncbi:MAG TPA: CotH kinase family protein, partial [Chthoniobacteraceae bacterium]
VAPNVINHEADPSVFEEVLIPNAASFLIGGNNLIAVHALNTTRSSSDFTIDVGLESSTAAANSASPTPGAVNSVFATAIPPSIAEVAHSPASPASGQPVTITARISDPQGVGSATLSYQIVAPGSYLRKTDPAYATSWVALAMADNGTSGDAVASDGIFSAQLPASLQVHRRLIRYRVSSTDLGGASVQVPYADDESPNFAYFVYNGVPPWTGSLNPSTTPAATIPSTVLSSMPVYHLLADATDVSNSQYVSSFNGRRMLGTMVYNGKVYDHVEFNNRGEASTYTSGKNKWRFHFNRARAFEALDNWGRPYAEPWDELNLNACASPWVPPNRGMAGIEEALSFRLYNLAGVHSPQTHFLHFRVVDAAAESSGASQFEGDQWGLYLAVEHPDGSFLDERGLPDGNVYKIESSRGDKKHQGETQPTDTSDWDAFLAGSRLVGQTEAWWRQNMNLEAYFAYRASDLIVGNVDIREGFNHCFYHHPNGLWEPVGWDFDFMFIPKTHQSGKIHQILSLDLPAIKLEFRNRARELLDLLCSDASASGGQFGQLVDEYAQLVNPAGQALTMADFDASMWNYHPRTASAHLGKFFVTPMDSSYRGGTRIRTLASPDHEGMAKYLVDYSTNTFPSGQAWLVNNGDQRGYGYKYLEQESADPSAPNRPSASYSGPSGFPTNDLRFTSSAFSDPEGSGTFSAMQWRIGELSAPGIPLHNPAKPRIYEVTDVWRSTELPFAAETRLAGANLQVGHTYRARVRHKDATGRWSRWSPPVQFVAGSVDAAAYQQGLAITEIMYNPAALSSAESTAGFTDKQDFEYLELRNIGATPLDLSGVGFTTGIIFNFPVSTVLEPGAHILAVKNIAAFNFRYGSGKPVAGSFTSGSLDNAGESLVLSYSGSVVQSFAYSDGSHPAAGQTVDPWPIEPDGAGYSLVLIDPASRPAPGLAANWRASRLPGGSAGSMDRILFQEWAAQYPAIGGPSDNADGDTRSNFAEYAVGSNPTQADPGPIQTGATEPLTVNGVDATYLTVTFTRQIGAEDVDYAVQFSPDLADWSLSGVLHESVLNGNGTATETWRSPNPITSTTRLFVRVAITGE